MVNIASIPGRLFRKLTGKSQGSRAGSIRLDVAGAKAGTEPIPIIPVELAGERYVVANSGEAPWVIILRASGKASLLTKDRRLPVTAVEIPVGERAPVIAAYRAKAGKAVEDHWAHHPDPDDHPVFRLTPDRGLKGEGGGGSAW